ncbi:putative glutamine amidotransferase [Leucobacter exalbidus]|uniref:Glutamine amidotransferase n=1 Tax=Leucobacter exalbidus TaxID=662960 RepID=A0A940T207_9MICO|nr:gamma-glutamyl-gamma-aminobutyrate hydrolase family protein [Leucobacter exalbidus]MBP1327375.1 putative glutamine amidotransferase [Leucobacter exalbidus]
MTDLVVDAAPFLSHADENPNGPLIPMVVSLTFPGMNQSAHDLQDEFTRIAFDAVRAAGGRPRLVDAAGPALQPAAGVFEDAAAIVILGGGDVDGACYGYDGPAPANEYGVDRRADDYCINLIQDAVSRDLPTLAICRGSQLLNVAFGGTLIPDIAEWPMHRGTGSPLFVDEDVILEEDSKIARIMGRTAVTVRNGHHQAVADVAPALRATAHAHDGIVEGTEHRDASWVVGIQWHPEEPEANLADRASIFSALVEQASKA